MNAIFIVTDKNYFKYTRACINSIKVNWPNHPEIIISYKTDKIEEEDFNFLRKNKITIKTYYSESGEFSLGPVNNDIIYQKFELWNDPYFDNFDNILHLDSDVLVLKPLDDLMKTDEFYIVSNVEKVPHINVFGNIVSKELYDLCNEYYIDDNIQMVNAGVFVIPKKYRSEMYCDKLFELGRTFNDHIKYADQSIISIWCNFFNIPISPILFNNFQSTLSSICCYDWRLINILHFSGIKPDDEKYLNWNWIDKDFAVESQKLFYKYLEM